MPKIVIISCHTPSLLWFRLDMMKFFIDNGFEVVAIGNEPEYKWKDLFFEQNILYRQINVSRNGTNPFADLKTYRSICKILKNEKPDVVFSYNAKAVIYGNAAAMKLNIPCFSMIAGVGSIFLKNDLKTKIIRRILTLQYKHSLKKCKKVIFQNDDDISLFIQEKIVKESQVIKTNGSGVNLDKFYFMKQPEHFSFVFIGRLLKDKGILEFLKASEIVKQQYPSVRISLIGPFDSNPSCINEKDLNYYIENNIIEYYGEQRNIIPYLEKSNVLVLPSYREGTPKTVLEAMACGRAIITTNAPGCRETIIDESQGYIVPIKDYDILAKKMLYLVRNPQISIQMGVEARKRAEELFDVNKVNKKIYESIKGELTK